MGTYRNPGFSRDFRHISEAWRSGRSMKHSKKRQDATRFRIGIANLSISPQRLRFLRLPATPEMRMGSRSGMVSMLLEMVSMLQIMQIYQPRIILNHHESEIVRNHEESSWFITIFFLKLSSRLEIWLSQKIWWWTIASVNLVSGPLGESSQWINWLVAQVSKSPMRAVPLLVGW